MLEQIAQYGQRAQADRIAGQGSIFDEMLSGQAVDEAEAVSTRDHPTISGCEFEKSELLQAREGDRSACTSPSIRSTAVREQLRRKTDCTLAELERRRDGEVVTVGGIVSAVKQLTTKRGEPMVFLALDDPTGGGEVVVFNSTYANARELCVADRILVIKGRIDHKQQGETKLIALEVVAFEAVPERTRDPLQARRPRGEGRTRPRARRAREGLPGRLARLRRARDISRARRRSRSARPTGSRSTPTS